MIQDKTNHLAFDSSSDISSPAYSTMNSPLEKALFDLIPLPLFSIIEILMSSVESSVLNNLASIPSISSFNSSPFGFRSDRRIGKYSVTWERTMDKVGQRDEIKQWDSSDLVTRRCRLRQFACFWGRTWCLGDTSTTNSQPDGWSW